MSFLFLYAVVEFFAKDFDVLRCLDAEFYCSIKSVKNLHFDCIVNDYALPDLSRHY
tara:strand:- start:708 stop:875 length:168 start_codon:yes stop_codon:yes gene_type:complete